ncbi:PaaX family transcriptional regulator [Streptomyces cadmiisoli]|uniref:PaaX family transcriptional regulator n=1 Tax=Streptomyces cadmiisoli TaxID=2184053 RepID=UPI00365BD1C9
MIQSDVGKGGPDEDTAHEDTAHEDTAGAEPGSGPALRPQSLMLNFLGNFVLGSDLCVYSGSIIDVLAHTGVGERATRSTLSRMVERGLLRRRRAGRRMYFGLTDRATAILEDGKQRLLARDAVNKDWDGTWTLLAFSLPEAEQRRRHDLRSRLTWAGFAPLIGGLWIAPGAADVTRLREDTELASHLRVFRSTADPATDTDRMIHDTWDLDTPAAGYRDFRLRWSAFADGLDGTIPGADADAIALQLRLLTEWLLVIRADPYLPALHLPADWPAAAAQDVFRRAEARMDPVALASAQRLLETMPLRD